jgi:hypothetical protein
MAGEFRGKLTSSKAELPLDRDVSLATDVEKNSIYDEEVFAWDWARVALSETGFAEMDRFEKIVKDSLETYKGMWSKKL